MQYWKQIKSSVSKKIFDNKEATSIKEKKEEATQIQKETKIKAILNIFKQKENEKENKELQQSTQKIESKPSTMMNGRIWMVSSSSIVPNDNQSIDQPIEQIQEVDGEAAAQFVSNICAFGEQCERQNKMRINKAKMQIFKGIQIEPIYLQQHSINKIMSMEMQYSYNQFRQQKCISLIERTQALVIERDSVDRAIETALTSGYLWQAHGIQNQNFIQICYKTIQTSMQNVDRLIDQVSEFRNRIKYLIQFYLKVNILNKKRVELAKKGKLLKKINSFKKDICQKCINIDQAFHIERDRQKMYAQLTDKPLISQKVMLTKNLLSLANEQNRKVRKIVEEKLFQWIDKQGKLQDKQIEKLLILLYFIRNEKMYKSNQCKIDLLKIVNKDKFVAELMKVRSWQGYRYLNDKGVKEKVGLFIEQLIKELTNKSPNQQEDVNKHLRKQNKRQMQIQSKNIGGTVSSVVKKNQNIIKF